MKTLAIAALAAGMAATAASANPTYSFQYNDGDSGSFGHNDNGSVFESISSTFHPGSNRLIFKVVFSNAVTEGFTLAINTGSNPKGHANEMALFYFDAADQSDVSVATYVYSGQNNSNSYQSRALIESIGGTSWLNSGNSADWTGAQFTEAFGTWLHPSRTSDVSYDNSNGSNRGGIGSLRMDSYGWSEGSDLGITVVPLPTGAAMAGLGLAGLASRRRRA